MVELLIGKKADVHVVDKSKRTALMLAAISNSPDVVRLLLQQGVNTSSQDECGWTAGHYAVFGGFDVNRQIIAKHTEERLKNFSQNNNPVPTWTGSSQVKWKWSSLVNRLANIFHNCQNLGVKCEEKCCLSYLFCVEILEHFFKSLVHSPG
ncbi:ankyrin repeat domain-containing protein 7-like [Lontra canadensis]|uniref:ankyrin repeat domain-containing protein 7-like n=1 Tax=Lontra canadensis TaxID=76717 RepID=UPI0013F37526|nr:ankyrin repeat domain-containing protein 7-like [Lontra canadensis]